MNSYYKELDISFRNFVLKPNIDFKKFFNPILGPGHHWAPVHTVDIVSDSAIEWLAECGFKLTDISVIFKLSRNFNGPVHIDWHKEKKSIKVENTLFDFDSKTEKPKDIFTEPQQFAINFIIEGDGEMQWVEYDNESTIIDKDGRSIRILDSWSGKNGIVKVGIPHRVLGSNTDRYCISIRPNKDTECPFDLAVARLGL